MFTNKIIKKSDNYYTFSIDTNYLRAGMKVFLDKYVDEFHKVLENINKFLYKR
jgi:hypothetical protein